MRDEINIKNAYLLDQRLEYILKLKEYYETILFDENLDKVVRKEYYKDKPLLNLIINLIYLPSNFLKIFYYHINLHKYKLLNKEIEVILIQKKSNK